MILPLFGPLKAKLNDFVKNHDNEPSKLSRKIKHAD